MKYLNFLLNIPKKSLLHFILREKKRCWPLWWIQNNIELRLGVVLNLQNTTG